MKNLLEKNGSLTQEGKRLFLDFKYGLEQVMLSDEIEFMSKEEVKAVGSYLTELVNIETEKRLSLKLQLENKLAELTDQEFRDYMTEKYSSVWQLIELSPEERKRAKALYKKL